MPASEQPAAGNAALRELLAVIAAAAAVPLPARPDDDSMRAYYRALGRRADHIAVYAAIQPDASPESLRFRAAALRELIDDEPLGYEATP
jgi:hypothetical protein